MRNLAFTLMTVISAMSTAGSGVGAQSNTPPPDLMSMSLEQLMTLDIDSVYGASGYKQKEEQAPACVTIITADQIHRFGYRTLADILRDVPGFYVSYDRNYDYVGERGFGRPGDLNTRILLLVDGHRINDDIYDQAYIGTDFPVDIDLIDRIEVIRGPNSSRFVASALLGVINVITKPVRDTAGLTFSGELASYGTFKSRLTYGRQLHSGLDMLLSATFYDSHGQDKLYFQAFDSPNTNNGIAENSDGDRFNQAFARFDSHGFTLEGAYGSRQKNIPTASWGTIFNDAGERTTDAQSYLDLKYNHHFGGDWGYTGQIYYSNEVYLGTYPYANSQGSPARVLNVDLAHGQWWGGEFAFSKQLAQKQTLILGAEYIDNFRQDQSNYDVLPYYQYFDSRQSSTIWGLYLQDAVSIRHDLTLELGLRNDHYSIFGATTNPRADLIYQPFERTTIKLLYGQSFRPPNAYELYYAGAGQEPNPRLGPETTKTFELVAEQTVWAGLRLAASAYDYPVRHLITATTDAVTGNVVYENSQRVNLKGLEFSLDKRSSGGLEAGISASFEHARDADTGGALSNSPNTLGQARLSVPLIKRRIFASTNLEYVSKRRTLQGGFAGAYLVPNFTLFTRGVLKGWEASASLYNAFNRIYSDPGSVEHTEDVIPQDGRTFRIKLLYRY